MAGDADRVGVHEERRLLAQLERRSWREVLATALADSRPALYARLTDPGQAAILSLLEIAAGERCLDATGGWGQIALPLARLARVVVLAPSSVRAQIIRRVAAQEDVALQVAAGELHAFPFAAAAFDVLLLHDLPGMDVGAATASITPLAALRDAARLLRPRGRLYLAAGNDLPALLGAASTGTAPAALRGLARYTALFASAGLGLAAGYACFPDHAQPRFLVPLALVDHFVSDAACSLPRAARSAPGLAEAYAGLAGEGIARHFAPSYAFILRLEGAASAPDAQSPVPAAGATDATAAPGEREVPV